MQRMFLLLMLAKLAGSHCHQNCPPWESESLNIHFIQHSHDDMGWLKTVDQYFWGLRRDIGPENVQSVLDTTIQELVLDPRRRFVYAETGFFWRWWLIQPEYTRNIVKSLVSNGQLEFVQGGWCAHDEATTHYTAIIDQMTFGLRKLNETFGECGRPLVAWQIDAFGHSKEMASLFAQMGFAGQFFGRMHYLDRIQRREEKAMEFIWEGSDDLGATGDLFTHAFYEHNGPPKGFCFGEAYCRDDPLVDQILYNDTSSINIDDRINEFVSYAVNQSTAYRTNHILMIMGGDFQYRNARRWFRNLDMLIDHLNSGRYVLEDGQRICANYSTPSCYLKAVNGSEIQFPVKTDDMFPFAKTEHSYWTGFYTSRPALKGFVRSSNNKLQVCKQQSSLAHLENPATNLELLQESMSVLQHHDAISGTSRQHVADDYVARLSRGCSQCQTVLNDAFKKHNPDFTAPLTFCPLANVSICNISQNLDEFVVTIFNGHSQQMVETVRVPVEYTDFKVVSPDGLEIPTQVTPTAFPIPTSKLTSNHAGNQASYNLYFTATIPALGFNSYTVKKLSNNRVPRHKPRKQKDCLFIGNEHFQLSLHPATGLLKGFTDFSAGHNFDLPFSQNFFWYKPKLWDNETEQASGAYVFRPDGTAPIPVSAGGAEVECEVDGKVLKELKQTFSPWARQTIRVFPNKPYAEFEWSIGPIPVDVEAMLGKEVITRYTTSEIHNNGIFYTDANGRQIMRRTLQLNSSEPIAANYFPIPTRIFINDTDHQLAVITDRSQGGSAIQDGSIELMLHRRLLTDDNCGLNEALNELENGDGLVVQGKHWVVFSSSPDGPRLHRFLAKQMFYQPIMMFSRGGPLSVTKFSGLSNASFPQNLNIVTLEQWRDNEILLRIEHFFQVADQDPVFSQPVTISLRNLFSTFEITDAEELTLAANQNLSDACALLNLNFSKTSRMDCQREGSNRHFRNVKDSLVVTFYPMEIRTFLCKIKPLTHDRKQ